MTEAAIKGKEAGDARQLSQTSLSLIRTQLKNVFWPNIFVGASLQILDIQQYASGLKLGPVARVPAKPLGEDGILNQNPIFEMGSRLIT